MVKKQTTTPVAENARLEAVVRKAFADAWAEGGGARHCDKNFLHSIHAKVPGISEADILEVVRKIRGEPN